MASIKKGTNFSETRSPYVIKELKEQLYHHLLIFQGRDPKLVGCRDMYKALAYRDRQSWWRKSILNVARIGKFSTDRTIREYAG